MKIIHLISGLENGGAEAILARLVSIDSKNHHEVISLGGIGFYGGLLKERKILIHTLNMPRGKLTLEGMIRLIAILYNSKPHILQTWMYHADFLGGFVGYLLGIKKIVWGIHNSNLDTDKTSWKTRMIAIVCSRLSTIIPCKIITCSEFAKSEHIRRGYAQEKFIVLPNGYSLDIFYPSESMRKQMRVRYGFGENEVVFGMVARWDVLKDHRNLFRSLQLLLGKTIEWRCILVGQNMDELNKDLVELIGEHGLDRHIIIKGIISNIREIYNGLDFHVLSSSAEAFPNAVAESMACGIPVVSTNAGDAQIIVGDTGWIVKTSDPVELSSAIHKAITSRNDSGSWNTKKESCRDRISELFTEKKMLDSYSSLWQSLGAEP